MIAALTTHEQMMRFNQAQVRAALRLYLTTGMLPSRLVRMQDLLKQAGRHTGGEYSRSRAGCVQAIADLDELLK